MFFFFKMRMPKGFLFFESPTATLGICKGQPLWGQVRFLGLFEKSGALMRLGMKDFPNFKWDGLKKKLNKEKKVSKVWLTSIFF